MFVLYDNDDDDGGGGGGGKWWISRIVYVTSKPKTIS